MTNAIAWMAAQPVITLAPIVSSSLQRGRKRGLPREDYEVIALLLARPERLTAVEVAFMIEVPVSQVYHCRERSRKGKPIVPPAEHYIRAESVSRPYGRCSQLRKVISEGASVQQAAHVLGISVPFARRILRDRLQTTVAELQQTRTQLIKMVRTDRMTIKAACKRLKISLWRGHRLLAANYDRK